MKRQRLILDIAMSILLVLQMLYFLIGEAYHEWAGILLIILFTIHNAINRKWYKTIPKGKYRRKRIVHTAVNAICIISCFLLLISGLSMARHSLPIPIIPMGAARIIHMIASYWGFIAISMHAGFHMAPLNGYNLTDVLIRDSSVDSRAGTLPDELPANQHQPLLIRKTPRFPGIYAVRVS